MSAGRRLILLLVAAVPWVAVACLDLVEDDPCVGAVCAPAGTGGGEAEPPPGLSTPRTALQEGCPCGANATASQKAGRACACAASGVDVPAYCHEVAGTVDLNEAVGADASAVVDVRDVATFPQGTVAAVIFDRPCTEGRCPTLALYVEREGQEARVHTIAECPDELVDGRYCTLKDPHVAVDATVDGLRFAVAATFSGDLRIHERACAADADCEGADVCGGGRCVPATCTDGVQNGDEIGVDCGGATCGPCDGLIRIDGNDGFVVIGRLDDPEQPVYDTTPWCLTGTSQDAARDVSFAPDGAVVVAGISQNETCVVPCGTATECGSASAVTFAGGPSSSCVVEVRDDADCATGFRFKNTQERVFFAHRFPSTGQTPACAVFLGGDGFNQDERRLDDELHGMAIDADGVVWLAGERLRAYIPTAGTGGSGGGGGDDYRPTRGRAGLLVRYAPSALTTGDAEATCLELDEEGEAGELQTFVGVGIVEDEVLVAGETVGRGVFDTVGDREDLLPRCVATDRDTFVLAVDRTDFGAGSAIRWVRSFGSVVRDLVRGFTVTSEGDAPRAVLVGRTDGAAYAAPNVAMPSAGAAALVVELARDPDETWSLRWVAQRATADGNPSDFWAAAFDGDRLLLAGTTSGPLELTVPVDPASPAVDVSELGVSREAFLLHLDPGATGLAGYACTLGGAGGAGAEQPGIGGAASCEE